MVGIAQLVRAPECGSGGRGFESHYSPHFFFFYLGRSQVGKALDFDSSIRRFESCRPSQLWRHSQVVRQRSAKPLLPGSNPGVASILVPIAQLDRVSDYESEGREFESLWARQEKI